MHAQRNQAHKADKYNPNHRRENRFAGFTLSEEVDVCGDYQIEQAVKAVAEFLHPDAQIFVFNAHP